MTDIQLCDYLRDYFKLEDPSEPVVGTITAVDGNDIELDVELGENHVWVGSIVEITNEDSPAYRHRSVVMGNGYNKFYTATQFNKKKLPKVGDTVKLSGGPLAEARVYAYEPDSVESAIKVGKKFFVVINCTGGEVEQVSLGNADHAIHTSQATYDIEVAAETLDLTGDDSKEDVFRVAIELPIFKDQLLCLIHWFRNQASNNATGRGKISFAYASYQRTGSPVRLKGAIMEFAVALR